MKTYKNFMAPGYTKNEIRTLLERVTPALKKQVLDKIEDVKEDEILRSILEAIQRDVMVALLEEKCKSANIKMNKDAFIDSIILAINKSGESANDQMDFLKELLAGEIFDCIKMVKDSHKKVVRLDSYVKTKSPIWPKVKDKFIENITKIDNQNIGPGEILFILATPGATKGNENNKGDVELASGYNVELKASGGTFSKPDKFADAKLFFINAFKDLGSDITAAEADEMGLGGRSVYKDSNATGGIPKALSLGSKKYSALWMEKNSGSQRQADKACEKLWHDICVIAMPFDKASKYVFNKTVKNGLTDPNEFIKQWNSNALNDYKEHGWDYVTLFDKISLDVISFKEGKDLYTSKEWNPGTEWMLRWTGGGGFSGTGSSTRIKTGPFKNEAIFDPGDTDFEKKIARKNAIRSSLESTFKSLSKKQSNKKAFEYSSVKALKNKKGQPISQGSKNLMNDNNSPKDFKKVSDELGVALNKYFTLKNELKFGFDKADRDLGKGFNNMKRSLGIR
jgi:hypothetical protein